MGLKRGRSPLKSGRSELSAAGLAPAAEGRRWRQCEYFKTFTGLVSSFQLGDAPVDIYFLFDSSNSMNDLQKRLKASANEIIENVRNLTENAQFGIGGYTDKPIVPFANEPTITGPADHKKVFAFQHHLTITNDYPALKTAIGNVQLYFVL